MWYKNLRWVLICVATYSSAIAQQHSISIEQYLDRDAKSKSHFFIGKTKGNIDQLSRRTGDGFVRKLSEHYYVLSVADTSGFELTAHANNEWKLPGNTKTKSPEFPADYLLSVLAAFDFNISFSDASSRIVKREGSSIRVHVANERDFKNILNYDQVVFMKAVQNAKEESPNSFQDISVNKINFAHFLHPEVSGEGITVSVKEKAPDTTDIDLKNRIFLSELADSDISLHANLIATIIAGGGNTHANTKGAAWQSEIVSTSFDDVLPDAAAVLSAHGISVQNHSYGTAIENFYGPEAVAYDESANENPTLLHVFSAGNSGELTAEDGVYAGIGQVANLTGNMKMAKNVLVVGGHYKDFQIDSRNSRGPAYDGRIKPEVIAFGPEGTSDGAAFVSGVSALIQQQYKLRFNQLPKIDLVKATLIGTADDLRTLGPDHVSGFGAINAYKAIELIRKQWFIEDSVSNGGTKALNITIPEGVSQIRFALCWIDPPAIAGATKALVNDLDFSLLRDGNEWLPWTLSSFPQIDSLNLQAKRGEDHINNIEMISIVNPEPGLYQLNVKGKLGESVQQPFAVAYWFDYADQFLMTFPTSADPVEAGREAIFRWGQTYPDQTATLEIQVGDEPVLRKEIFLQNGFHPIVLPNVSGIARAVVKIDGINIDTTEFVISNESLVNVEFNCDETAMISWPEVENASGYKLFRLGSFYMDSILTTSDTSFVVTKSRIEEPYFAVTPVFNGPQGQRSAAYNVNTQGVSCYYINLIAEATETDDARITLNASTTFNLSEIVWQKRAGRAFVNIGQTSAHDQLQYVFFDDELISGVTAYRALIKTSDNQTIITDTASLYYANDVTYEVFPNPVQREVEWLNVLSNANNLSIIFYDSTGKCVKSEPILTNLSRIQMNDLLPGLYHYSIQRDVEKVSSGHLLVK